MIAFMADILRFTPRLPGGDIGATSTQSGESQFERTLRALFVKNGLAPSIQEDILIGVRLYRDWLHRQFSFELKLSGVTPEAATALHAELERCLTPLAAKLVSERVFREQTVALLRAALREYGSPIGEITPAQEHLADPAFGAGWLQENENGEGEKS
jgi:hypothetical protein